MPVAEKISRKKLREPDEFVTFTQRALGWLYDNRTMLIAAGLIVIAVILGFFGWRWYVEEATLEASSAFVDARDILDAPVAKSADPSEAGTSQADGSYPSEQDKLRAALAALDQVQQNYGSSQTASLAAYFIGESHWRLGEYDQAIAAFERYLESEGADGELAAFAVEGIAASLENKGEYAQAKKHYQRLTEPPFENQRARALYHLARMEQALGDEQAAAGKFRELLDEFPQTPFRREAETRLSLLPPVEAPADDEAPAADTADEAPAAVESAVGEG
jgi:tetratricopeptide (TPR) repeat protein